MEFPFGSFCIQVCCNIPECKTIEQFRTLALGGQHEVHATHHTGNKRQRTRRVGQVDPGWITFASVNETLATALCSLHSVVKGINEGGTEMRRSFVWFLQQVNRLTCRSSCFQFGRVVLEVVVSFEHDCSMSVGVTQWFTTDRAVAITLHLNEINSRICYQTLHQPLWTP